MQKGSLSQQEPPLEGVPAKPSWWFSSLLSPIQHISHQPLVMPFPTLMSAVCTPSASERHFIKTKLLLLLNFTFLVLYVVDGGFSEQVAFIFCCRKVYFIDLSCMQNANAASTQTFIRNLPWNRNEYGKREPVWTHPWAPARLSPGWGHEVLVEERLPYPYPELFSKARGELSPYGGAPPAITQIIPFSLICMTEELHGGTVSLLPGCWEGCFSMFAELLNWQPFFKVILFACKRIRLCYF